MFKVTYHVAHKRIDHSPRIYYLEIPRAVVASV
jgi:hypothetical protein